MNLLQVHHEEDNRLLRIILEISNTLLLDKKKCNQLFNSGILQILSTNLEDDNDITEIIIEIVIKMMKLSELVSEAAYSVSK